MYNKSEIMKRAWSGYFAGYYMTFSQALKAAWANEKKRVAKERETVVAEEIAIGNTVSIVCGDYDNNSTCTITAIERGNSGLIFRALSKNGNLIEFCAKRNERLRVHADERQAA